MLLRARAQTRAEGSSRYRWWVLWSLLAGLGTGVVMPSTSSVMANEALPNEFGVKPPAQMLATQVGEVAGVQILETLQQASVRRDGLVNAKPDRRCSRRSTCRSSSGRASPRLE